MYVVAIDSGGTKVNGAVVDENGHILEKKRYGSGNRDGDIYISIYQQIIEDYCSRYPIQAVGIACNGMIDDQKGIVLAGPNYSNWNNRPIAQELSQKTNLPVVLGNDCIMGVAGEWWCGALRNLHSFVGIMIGTGLGGAHVDHGKLIRGDNFGAGEIGHMILHRGGYPCFCGQRGCVERYVSGTALWTIYNLHSKGEKISSGYEFFDRYRCGDPLAISVLDEFVWDLAQVMVSLTDLCAPQAVLIGGGIADTHDLWEADLEKKFRSMLSPMHESVKILYAECGNDAALLGVAKSAMDRLSQNKHSF